MFGRRRQVSRHRNRPLHAHTTYARIRRGSASLTRRPGARLRSGSPFRAGLDECPPPTRSVRERGDDRGVADVVHQLFATEEALDKLGGRGISIGEAEQLLRNRHVLLRNLRGHPDRRQRQARRLLIGLTDGERVITLVVQATIEPTTWLLITGWDATAVERRLIERL